VELGRGAGCERGVIPALNAVPRSVLGVFGQLCGEVIAIVIFSFFMGSAKAWLITRKR